MRILMFFAGDVTEIDGYLADRLHAMMVSGLRLTADWGGAT
jgi:hypothetical protein